MKKWMMGLLAVAAMTMAAGSAQAALLYVSGTYTQNFNSLVSTGTGAWANDSTLTGWYARTDLTATISNANANTGSTTTAGMYSFGVASNSDRALGWAPTNAFTGGAGTGQAYIGLEVNNSSGGVLTDFDLSYRGEQWRLENGGAAGTITVQYKINATAVNDATGWTSISALTFTSPKTTGTTGALDGNASGNFVNLSTATVSGLTWNAGDKLWIRFVDLNDSGNDQFMGIDDVNFSAMASVPEPSTYALLGIGLASLMVLRRGKSAAKA